jgi:hypothetical protein
VAVEGNVLEIAENRKFHNSVKYITRNYATDVSRAMLAITSNGYVVLNGKKGNPNTVVAIEEFIEGWEYGIALWSRKILGYWSGYLSPNRRHKTYDMPYMSVSDMRKKRKELRNTCQCGGQYVKTGVTRHTCDLFESFWLHYSKLFSIYSMRKDRDVQSKVNDYG